MVSLRVVITRKITVSFSLKCPLIEKLSFIWNLIHSLYVCVYHMPIEHAWGATYIHAYMHSSSSHVNTACISLQRPECIPRGGIDVIVGKTGIFEN